MEFIKMDAYGNDFIIFDTRKSKERLNLSKDDIIRIASRDNRITGGCDQVLILEPAVKSWFGTFMRIYNADGGEVNACGNATRCIATLNDYDVGQIETNDGIINTRKIKGQHHVNMGFAKSFNNRNYVNYVNVGNPHIIEFTCPNDIECLQKEATHTFELFKRRGQGEYNCSVGYIDKNNMMQMVTYERGVGLTKSCGTAAVAALTVAKSKFGLNELVFPNGLRAYFSEDGIWIVGKAKIVSTGKLESIVYGH